MIYTFGIVTGFIIGLYILIKIIGHLTKQKKEMKYYDKKK